MNAVHEFQGKLGLAASAAVRSTFSSSRVCVSGFTAGADPNAFTY